MSKGDLWKGGTGTSAHQLQGGSGDKELPPLTPDNANIDNVPNFTISSDADAAALTGPFISFAANVNREPVFFTAPEPPSIKTNDALPPDAMGATAPSQASSSSLAQNIASNGNSLQINVTFDQSVLNLGSTLTSEVETAVRPSVVLAIAAQR